MIVDVEVNNLLCTYLPCTVVRGGGGGSVPGRKVHKLYNNYKKIIKIILIIIIIIKTCMYMYAQGCMVRAAIYSYCHYQV